MKMGVITQDGFLGQVTEFAVEQKKTDGFAEFGTRSRRIGLDLLCLLGCYGILLCRRVQLLQKKMYAV
jgi:hypothetical protein